jgi:hypothetical protein
MNNFSWELWMELYREALLEPESSLVSMRIREARAEIVNRSTKLRDLPIAPYDTERTAMLNALCFLQKLEQEYSGEHSVLVLDKS